MPVYNAGSYLDQAIDSVLAQSFSGFEFICVNDGSTDGSLEILNKWANRDSRMRIISRANTGIVGALNDGLAASRCELIARMDADDICVSSRLEKQVAYMDSHTDCVALGSTALVVDEESSPIKRWVVPPDHALVSELHLSGAAGQMIHPTVIMRKAAVTNVGGYRAEWQWVEDYDLFLRLADFGKLANLQEDLLLYRFNARGISQSKRKLQEELTTKLCNQVREQKGLPAIVRDHIEAAAETSREDVLRNWIEWSWREHHYGTAQKHSRRLLRAVPFSLRSWRLFIKSHMGHISVPLTAAKRGLLKQFSSAQK